MKNLIHIVFFFCSPLLALSQQYYIKGHVKDEMGKPMQNVSIRLHSTGYLFFSGQEGSFGIPAASRIDTLLIAYDGYFNQKLVIDASKPLEVKLRKDPSKKNQRLYKLASQTTNLKREMQQQWFLGDETYASLVENGFIDAGQYPSTGLTLNVDRASYSNIRRFLATGSLVPPDAVRMEELLNYFNFNYSEPKGNAVFDIQSTLTTCPWNKKNLLLLTQVNSKKLVLDKLPPSHLVFLVDVSGSMDMPNRLPLLKSGFKALVNNLRAVDTVSIVVYGGTVGIAMPATGGGDKESIFKAIDSLQAGGSTPGESGIRLAYQVARQHFIKGGNNRIILATDGDFNVGLRKEEELEEMIVREREKGVYLTCLGIGMGNYKDSKIQTLAQWGNGNFAYLDSYAEADKVLLKEFAQTLFTVAEDAFMDVHFNPKYVKEYRLIGFDNKMGAIRDTTATIEGGEVGSAYSAMVAFELTPAQPIATQLGKGFDENFASYRLRYRQPGTDKKEELKQTPVLVLQPFTEIAKSQQFASAVLMFGGMVRGSKFVSEAKWEQVLQLATAALDPANFSQKEFLTLVQHAKNIYSKKRKKGED